MIFFSLGETIVPKKISSSCHALRFTPTGTGENQRITPVVMEAISGLIEVPCHGCTGVKKKFFSEDLNPNDELIRCSML